MMKTKKNKKICCSSLRGNIKYKNPVKQSILGGRCCVSHGNYSFLQNETLRIYLNRLFLFAQTWVNITPGRRAGGGFPWPTIL